MDEKLMEKVLEYNRSIIAQERKAKKVEEIKALVGGLSTKPKLTELLEFLRQLREIIKEVTEHGER